MWVSYVAIVITAFLSWMLCREARGAAPDERLDVEAEQHHVAVLDDIVLAFGAHLAGVPAPVSPPNLM